MRIPSALPALFLIAFAGPAAAETLYVTDILRLGLYSSPSTSGTPIQTLVSGAPLDVLERQRFAARVRTSNGAEGWVKLGYLVEVKPAQARLAELEDERNRLATEVEGLMENLSGREQELKSLAEARRLAEQKAGAGETELKRLREQNESLSDRLARYRFAVPIQWTLAMAAVTLTGGFIAGLWFIDHRSRKRHGGFRIY